MRKVRGGSTNERTVLKSMSGKEMMERSSQNGGEGQEGVLQERGFEPANRSEGSSQWVNRQIETVTII